MAFLMHKHQTWPRRMTASMGRKAQSSGDEID